MWASEVSDIEWDPNLDRNVRTSIQRVLEALVPDGESGLVKSTDGPLAGVLTDDALYLVALSRITADNVNHSITPVARRIGLDQFITTQRRNGLEGMIRRIKASAAELTGARA